MQRSIHPSTPRRAILTQWSGITVVLLATLCVVEVCHGALRIEPAVLDFGVVKPHTGHTQSVKITNDGPGPVKLLGAEVECKACTKVELEPTELAPGKHIEVPITFAPPAHVEGEEVKKVLFRTSDPGADVRTVTLRAQVTTTAALAPSRFAFTSPQAAGEKVQRELEVVNVSEHPIKLLYATGPLEGPRISVGREPIAPGGRGKLTATWILPLKPGDYRGNTVVYLDHPTLKKLVLPFLVEVVAGEEEIQKDAPTATDGAADPARPAGAGATQPATAPATTAPAAAASPPPPKLIRLELKDGLVLKDLVEVIAAQLQLNLVYDEAALNVPAAVRLAGPLREDALLPLLRSVLQSKGLALVGTERREIWRIVATKDAPQMISAGEGKGGPDQLVTEVISPRFIEAEALAGVLKGFATAGSGQVTPVPESKLLIVTDYKTQVDRLRELVAVVDQPGPRAETGVEVVPLKAAEAGPLVERMNTLLSQLKSVNGDATSDGELFVSADAERNQVLLVGRVADFDRVRTMIQQFDTAPPLTRVDYALEDEQRPQASSVIDQILGPAARTVTVDGTSRVVFAGPTVSVIATEGQHQRIREMLDRRLPEEAADAITLKAYRVQNRDAAEIEATLTRLIGITSGGLGLDAEEGQQPLAMSPPAYPGDENGGFGGPQNVNRRAARTRGAATQPAMPSAGPAAINVALDIGTNSLLIAAPPPVHRRVSELIRQLDQRQAQVLLEVMLVSVSDTNTFSYAVEAAMNATVRGGDVAAGSDFGIGSGPLNDRSLGVGPGFNAAVLDPGKFSIFVRALSQSNKAKVLSLPQVLALDNKPALIQSVQQEPYVSLNASETVSTTSFGGFAEAGTTLEVTPHIAPADYLNLEYRLEVSSFTGNSPAASVPPPRRSDTISSFISVPDGHTVIVGGLKSDTRSKSVSKIPGFGDIPILGILGRSENHSRGDSTFYIFVRPTILRAARFEDLKFLSDQPRAAAGLSSDYPQSDPRYIR